MLNKIIKLENYLENLFRKINYKYAFVLCVIVISYLTLFPRSAELIANNYIFLIDQGRDYMDIKNIVINHKFTLIGSEIGGGAAGTQGIFQGPVYYYLLSAFFILFNGDPWGGMLLMFSFSAVAVIFSYYFANKIFKNRWYSLLFTFFIAISHPLIDQARFIWNNHPSAVFILLAFYFAYLSYKKDKKYLFLATFFSAFIYNFEIATAVPMTIAYVLFTLIVLKINKIKHFFSIAAGIIIGILPMLLFEARHNFMAFKGIFNYLITKPSVSDNVANSNLLENHLNNYITNFFDTFTFQNPNYAFIIFIGFLFTSLIIIFKEKDKLLKPFLMYLVISIAVTIIVFSFLKNYIYYYYLYHLNITYIIFITYFISKMLRLKKNAIYIKLLTILMIIVIAVNSINFSFFNTIKNINDYGGTAKIKGKTDALDYIYRDASGKAFGLFIFTPPIYTYAYDYLVWWYASKKYNYTPHSEKKGTFYLLIEKDPSKSWSYKGWIETVIKVGKVEYTKMLPSGFIIQKRTL